MNDHPEGNLDVPEKATELELQMQRDWEQMTNADVLPERVRTRLYRNIRSKIYLKKPRHLVYYLAAILLLGAFFSYFLIFASTPFTTYDHEGPLTLIDGTRIKLGASSRLRVSNWSGDAPREVWLEGDATFHVIPSLAEANSRFIVYVDDVQVEALGTKFKVNSTHGMVKVTLESGKVIFKHNTSGEVEMNPGDCFEYDLSDGTFRQVAPNRHQPDSAVMEFEDMSMESVINRINARRDSQLIITDADLLRKRFSGAADLRDMSTFYRIIGEVFDVKLIPGDSNKLILLTTSTNEVH